MLGLFTTLIKFIGDQGFLPGGRGILTPRLRGSFGLVGLGGRGFLAEGPEKFSLSSGIG